MTKGLYADINSFNGIISWIGYRSENALVYQHRIGGFARWDSVGDYFDPDDRDHLVVIPRVEP